MRRHPGRTAVRLAAALVAAFALPASAAARPPGAAPPARTGPAHAAVAPRSGARCDIVRGDHEARAVCLNPDPVTTRLQLHVTCARWWDPATDTEPVDDGPAQWVSLTGHCWKELRSAWLTRRPVP